MAKASKTRGTDEGVDAWLSAPDKTPDTTPDTTPDRTPGEPGVPKAGSPAEGTGETVDSRDAEIRATSAPVLVEPGRRFVAAVLEIVLFIGTFGIGWLVWSMIEWRDGRTPAKRLLRDLAVADAWSGEPVGWQRMAVRELGAKIGLVGLFGVATFGLGWAIAAALVLSETRASLWDRIAGTTVVSPGG